MSCVYKEFDIKKIWCRNNGYSQKWSFYWFFTWKFLFSGEGANLLWEKKLFQVRDEWAIFLLVEKLPLSPTRENLPYEYIYYIYNIYIILYNILYIYIYIGRTYLINIYNIYIILYNNLYIYTYINIYI